MSKINLLLRSLLLAVMGTAASLSISFVATAILSASSYDEPSSKKSHSNWTMITEKKQVVPYNISPTPNPQPKPPLPLYPTLPSKDKIIPEMIVSSIRSGINQNIKQTPKKTKTNPSQAIQNLANLFATPTSLGMVAIGVAEGNYHLILERGGLYVQLTRNYYGHTDPGNLSWGQRVTNYGLCSDQGRSKGNIQIADQMCIQRVINRLPVHIADLIAAGIDPDTDLEALINTADLYNQANPIHSRYFPYALVRFRENGYRGLEAIANARTATFYLNENKQLDLASGRNTATGLLGICIRERRSGTEWDCVYRDQYRRVKAINTVLEKFRMVYSNKKL